MTWIRLDDQFADHPKVIAAGPLASWLFVCGLTYCARYLTDGFIPAGQVRRLADVEDVTPLVTRLVTVGLWECVDNGYRVHDYLDYQPSADQVRAERAATARRQAAWRVRRHAGSPTPSSNAVTNASPVPIPYPSRRERVRAREGNRATADAAPSSLFLSQKPSAPEPEQKPEPVRDVAVVASSPPGKSPEEAEHGPMADPKADPYADLHEACVVALGHGPTTGRMRRKWREGLADLAALHVTPDDVPKLVRQYHAKYGDTIPCEPWNLADHYSELGASPHVLSNLNGASRQHPAEHPPDPAEAARRKRAIFAQHGIPIPLKPDLDTLGG